MKERQRWQPEEDAVLRAYVKQYGPKEWNLVSQRMGKPLDRDAKSCLERWKNYLKPGIKKGSLSEEEQSLVISLQAKYGNKWKKIAAEVPGRTAKRLGKWWEVFKEKQLKEKRKERQSLDSQNSREGGKYDHILETFAEKYVQKKICPTSLPSILRPSASPSSLLTLGASNDATYADNFNFANVNSIPSVSSSKLVSHMPNIPGSVGLTLPDLKQKLSSVSEIEPRLTLESPGRIRCVREPELALQCSVSAMDMELTCTSLVAPCSAIDTTSTLPPWMSNVPSAPVLVSGSTDVKTPASTFNLERENPFLSKSIQLNSSPSVSLSLSPSLSDPVVSSGSASPASEVIAPRSWLQDATRQKEIINGISGSVNENKHNLPWCSSDKPVGTLSFEPILPSTKQGVDNLIMQQLPTFFQDLKDLEEGRQSWLMHKKEATWRLNRLEQQLESEKTRKRREKIEEVSAKIRALREEEMTYLDKLESDCREQLSSFQRDAEIKEAKMMEQWTAKHVQLTKFLEQMLYQFPDAHRFLSNDMR